MKTFNVGLVGFGKMGKIYAKEIKKKKEFKIVDILEHKNILKNPKKLIYLLFLLQ
jgi:prephenate dehydrogenase